MLIQMVSLSVLYMGEMIWSYDYGTMNYSDPSSSSTNQNTPFPVASVSKVFTVGIHGFHFNFYVTLFFFYKNTLYKNI